MLLIISSLKKYLSIVYLFLIVRTYSKKENRHILGDSKGNQETLNEIKDSYNNLIYLMYFEQEWRTLQ